MKNIKFLEKDIEVFNKMKVKPLLFVKDLTKKYPGRKSPAIQNISLNVYHGEFHAFIGANGAGKTTTIKSLIGAYANWSGTVLIDGIKNNKEDAKLKLGYIPENARFPDKFSAISYLIWMGKLSGLTTAKAKAIAEKNLKEQGMWNVRHKSPNTFSSGQKKKILLSQALIHNPDLLIMDEPAANLDPKARTEFFNMLLALKQQGKSIFISSHILAEIDKYADSATILDGGKIVFSGTKEQLNKLFTKKEWICKTSDDKKFLTILKANKIHYSLNVDGTYSVSFINEEKLRKIEKILYSKKIFFSELLPYKYTLQDVYDKLVIKGSVDTMN